VSCALESTRLSGNAAVDAAAVAYSRELHWIPQLPDTLRLWVAFPCARGVAISRVNSPVFAPRSGSQRYFLVAVGRGTSVNRKHTTTRLRMAHVTCPECGEEVFEPLPTCSKCDAPPAKAARATTPPSVPAQRHKTHPVTWVATAAIIPLLCWDAWQTYKEARVAKMSADVKFGRAPRESGYAPRLDEQVPDPMPVVRAWMGSYDARLRRANKVPATASSPSAVSSKVLDR